MIAALYVETGGTYYGLDDVDPWDEERDARKYAGPWPVVAHPPCARWCMLASVNEKRWGTPIGSDNGCFAAALQAVRTFGGVLEHPAYSLAWTTYGLPTPQRGGWQRSLFDDGWVTEVSQVAYGCLSRKRTWLYLIGEPTELRWTEPEAFGVIGGGVNTGQSVGRPKIAEDASSATPATFRDVLLGMARSAQGLAQHGQAETGVDSHTRPQHGKEDATP